MLSAGPLLVDTVESYRSQGGSLRGSELPGLQDVVDLLGSVTLMWTAITSRGLRLEPGLQHLDGDAAFALVSFGVSRWVTLPVYGNSALSKPLPALPETDLDRLSI